MWHGFVGLGILWSIEPFISCGLCIQNREVSARVKIEYVIESEESWGERDAYDVSTRMLRFGFEIVKGWMGMGGWFFIESQVRWEVYERGGWLIRERVFEERKGIGMSMFLLKRYKTFEIQGGFDWRGTLTPYFSVRKNF